MLKFLTKKTDNPSSSNSHEKPHKDSDQDIRTSKYVKIDLNTLPADPGERPSMEKYHVNQRDKIRRAYLQKKANQPRFHSFQQREIGGKARRFNVFWFDDYKARISSTKTSVDIAGCDSHRGTIIFSHEVDKERFAQ